MRFGLIRSVFFIVLVALAGCSSGGGGGSNGGGKSKNYSVTLSVSEVTVDITYGMYEANGTATVDVTFQGDGLLVGPPIGEMEDAFLSVDIVGRSTTSAQLIIGYNTGAHFNPGVYTRKLRIVTGNENGENLVYKDLTVKLRQLNGFEAGAITTVGEYQPTGGSFEVSTDGLSWQATTQTPWLVLTQSTGTGTASIAYTIDYSNAPAGVSTGAIQITSTTSGDSATSSVPITLNNNIVIYASSASVGGEWGDTFGPMNLSVKTYLENWQLSSSLDGVSFGETTGSGNAEVSVTFDSRVFAVGNGVANLTAASQGVEFSVPVNVYTSAPTFTESRNSDLYLIMVKNVVDPQPGLLDFALTNGSIATWTVSNLPDWLTASALTGNTAEILSITPNDLTAPEGQSEATFNVTVDIPGEPVKFNVTARVTVEPFGLDPVRHSYAFSDYATTNAHSGSIEFRGLSSFSEQDLQLALATVSSVDWLVVDDATFSGINFHLDTAALAEGYHQASLVISVPDNPFYTSATVYVGYYKTASEIAAHTSIETTFMRELVPSPVGPWAYLTTANETDVAVFNYNTGEFGTPISFSTASNISELIISDDGKYLIAHDTQQNRVYIYNFITQSQEAYIDDVYYNDEVKFIRLNGAPLIYYSRHWYDLEAKTFLTSELDSGFVEINHFVGRFGDGILTASPIDCGVDYMPFSFSRLAASVTFGAAVPTIGGCSTVAFSISEDQNLLANLNTNNKTLTKSLITPTFSLQSQASVDYEDGFDVISLAINNAGVVLMGTISLGDDTVRTYNTDMSNYSSIALGDTRSLSQIASVKFSSDGKFGIYVDVDMNYETSKVVVFPVVEPE